MDEIKKLPKEALKFGKIAFIIGIFIAVFSGAISGYTERSVSIYVVSILVILGLIIGLINITQQETPNFLFAGLVLFLISILGKEFLLSVDIFGPYLSGILNTMITLFIPAMIMASLKMIWDYSKDQ